MSPRTKLISAKPDCASIGHPKTDSKDDMTIFEIVGGVRGSRKQTENKLKPKIKRQEFSLQVLRC